MIGQTILHYTIVEELGRGGMGIVYRAEDTKLHRDVALKFLPPNVASSDEDRVRFMTEARAAAGLSHPNITHINTVEEADDQVFIVMELVDGVELKEAIAKGQLPVDQAIGIGRQIAAGLQAAHEQGVVHRDIKSSNIMLTPDGQVKIMDFGLAKVRGGAQLTKVGTTIGTAAYMSPEQARGDEVDERTDIWSLGVVMYEMLSGSVPFKSDYEQAAIYSILNEDPDDLRSIRPEVPGSVADVVKRALGKEPANRYGSAAELRSALEADGENVSTHDFPAPTQEKQPFPLRVVLAAVALCVTIVSALFFFPDVQSYDSLAVLPFENVGGDESTEYLSDGITESLISTISGIPDLRVMSRSSVFRFKGDVSDPKGIGEQLGVVAVLSGRVQGRGEDLLISAELIDVSDNSQLWGAQYNRPAADILAVQKEITREISQSLRLRLGDQEASEVAYGGTESSEAYQLYLKGRFFWNKRTIDDTRTAVGFFNQAVEADPTYAAAHAGIADGYIILGGYNAMRPSNAYPVAEAAARRAIEIDPTHAEAYASLGDINIHHQWDWDEAEEMFNKAAEYGPDYATGHQWRAEYLATVGRHEESIAAALKGRELDPIAPIISTYVGWSYYMARDFETAKREFEQTIAVNPDFPWARAYYAEALQQLGMMDEMIEELEGARNLYEHPMILSRLGYGYGVAGRTSDAEETLSQLHAAADTQYISPHYMALVHQGLGNRDEALSWLEMAFEDGSPTMFMTAINPIWDPVRDEVRFQAIIERMGLGEQ